MYLPRYDSWDSYLGEEQYSEKYLRLILGGGVPAGSVIHVGLGASIKSWMFSGLGGDETAWAGDIGFLLRAVPIDDATIRMSTALGASYSNLGGDVDSTRLARRLRAGLGFRVEGPHLDMFEELLHQQLGAGSVATYLDLVDRPEDSNPTIHTGLEVGLFEMFYLRTGYIYDRDRDTNDPTYGAGLAIKLDPVMARLDYAYRSHGNDVDGENKFGASAGIAF